MILSSACNIFFPNQAPMSKERMGKNTERNGVQWRKAGRQELILSPCSCNRMDLFYLLFGGSTQLPVHAHFYLCCKWEFQLAYEIEMLSIISLNLIGRCPWVRGPFLVNFILSEWGGGMVVGNSWAATCLGKPGKGHSSAGHRCWTYVLWGPDLT